jgi:hypothetical protein
MPPEEASPARKANGTRHLINFLRKTLEFFAHNTFCSESEKMRVFIDTNVFLNVWFREVNPKTAICKRLNAVLVSRDRELASKLKGYVRVAEPEELL